MRGARAGVGTEREMRKLLRVKSLVLEGKAALRSEDVHLPPGPANQRSLVIAAAGLHLSSQGSGAHQEKPAGQTNVKRREKTFLTVGVMTRQGTYGVHLSLYSLAMVSMPPLLATAM